MQQIRVLIVSNKKNLYLEKLKRFRFQGFFLQLLVISETYFCLFTNSNSQVAADPGRGALVSPTQ